MITDRRALAARVAETLAREIARGAWKEWLPQERSLSATLGVSRNTVRAALLQLRQKGLVDPVRGKGYRLLARRGKRAPAATLSRQVAVLSPVPLSWLRPAVGMLIDQLRVSLFAEDLHLEIHHGKQYFRANPGPALSKLASQHPVACWILLLSNEPMQQWFNERRIPCVISGTGFPALQIPSIDLDHVAIASHATGRLLAAGHRRLVMLLETPATAGNLECEQGFNAMLRKTPGAEGRVLRHASGVDEVRKGLLGLFKQKPPPTGFLIVNSYYYLTVSGVLQQLGLRVPQDVSLICTDMDHFLPFVVPVPCHYRFNAENFAQKLARRVVKIAGGEIVRELEARIFPTFVAGDSMAPPRVG